MITLTCEAIRKKKVDNQRDVTKKKPNNLTLKITKGERETVAIVTTSQLGYRLQH